MSCFRLIIAALLIGAGSFIYGLWSVPLPPLREPTAIVHQTRGPKTPEQIEYENWLRAIKARQAGLVATAVTFDTETVTLIVGILMVMTLLLALLSKYLIAPIIAKQLTDFMVQMDTKFVDRRTVEANQLLNDARYEAIEKQLDQIWERVK